MKKAEITEEFAQQLLNYLSTCPYGQVFQLVQGLAALQWVEVDNEFLPVPREAKNGHRPAKDSNPG